MVRRTKHKKSRKKTRKAKHGLPVKLAKLALEKGTPYAKKHLTKENIRKAAEASKAASKKLFALLRKKKKANSGQRITMSIFRE